MLTLFSRDDTAVRRHAAHDPNTMAGPVIWYDLFDPTPDEITLVEQVSGQELPSREEMQEIEASSRLYEENSALFLTASLLAKVESDRPETHAITFIVTRSRLITLRYADPLPFLMFGNRLLKAPGAGLSGDLLFLGLMEAVIDRVADVLERVSADVERLGRSIFGPASQTAAIRGDLRAALSSIGRSGTLVSQISESLVSISRAIAFFQAAATWINKDGRTRIKVLTRDIRWLHEHAVFLSQKTNFLLDATLGLINIEQNSIIKIFSVAAVAFLPPTLIASIYGMNFHHMPELDWPWGYPLALCLMLMSAIVPFLYFKRKGWL